MTLLSGSSGCQSGGLAPLASKRRGEERQQKLGESQKQLLQSEKGQCHRVAASVGESISGHRTAEPQAVMLS